MAVEVAVAAEAAVAGDGGGGGGGAVPAAPLMCPIAGVITSQYCDVKSSSPRLLLLTRASL